MNIKGIILLLAILLLNLPAFSQQWQTTNADYFARYDDIYFHSANTGWAVSWAVNGQGMIFKTVDGGDNWALVYSSDVYFRAVEFLNEDVGFAGTLDGVFLKTTDGGSSWVEIQDLVPSTIPGICGLSHVGDNVYGVGIFSYPAYFIKSTDQGQTWTYKDLSAYADGLVECHFIDENVGFLAGVRENSGGIILKTTNGGDSWEVVLDTQAGTEYIWKLDFVTDQIAYGAVQGLGVLSIDTKIVKTTDGGNNWTIHQVDSTSLFLQGIGFINQDTGWVGPVYYPLYETTDGGLTWNRTNLYRNINRFFRVNPELMYASGSTIYKYHDVSVSTQMASDYNYSHSHSISMVAPNPFSDNADFSVHIDKKTRARLDLFNSSGQQIENFYSGQINRGEHHFHLNSQKVGSIPAGMYYLVLRTNEGFVSSSVVKGSND